MTGIFDFTNARKIIPFDFFHNHHYYLDEHYPVRPKEVDAVSGAFILIKRKVFNALSGFDEHFFMYLEDIDFCIRAKQLGYKTIFCPTSTIIHEGGASSKNVDKINHQAWSDSRKYYFKKHSNIIENAIIQPIFLFDDLLTTVWQKLKSLSSAGHS